MSDELREMIDYLNNNVATEPYSKLIIVVQVLGILHLIIAVGVLLLVINKGFFH